MDCGLSLEPTPEFVQPETRPVETEVKVEEAPKPFEEDVQEERPLEGQEVEKVLEEGEYIVPFTFVAAKHSLISESDFTEKPTVVAKPTKMAAAEVVEHAEVPTSEEVELESAVESAEVTETKVEEKVKVSGTKMEVAPAKTEVGELEVVKDEAPLGKKGG